MCQKKVCLYWRGIIATIPTHWKQNLKHGFIRNMQFAKGFMIQSEDDTSADDTSAPININIMSTKMIYQIFIHRFGETPTSQKKYSDEFGILDEEWDGIYSLPFKVSIDVRTRIFQYKINLNCLMTNSKLFKMRIISNDECSFCNSHQETMGHVFFDCIYTQHFWTSFIHWWMEISQNEIYLDNQRIIFGIDTRNPDTLLNLCVVLAKKVIYDSRFKNQKPNMTPFLKTIKFNYMFEKQIAIDANNLQKFKDKWNNCLVG